MRFQIFSKVEVHIDVYTYMSVNIKSIQQNIQIHFNNIARLQINK